MLNKQLFINEKRLVILCSNLLLTKRKQNFRHMNIPANIWIFWWENLVNFLRIFDFIHQINLTNKTLRFSCFFWIFHENFSKKFHQKNEEKNSRFFFKKLMFPPEILICCFGVSKPKAYQITSYILFIYYPC